MTMFSLQKGVHNNKMKASVLGRVWRYGHISIKLYKSYFAI